MSNNNYKLVSSKGKNASKPVAASSKTVKRNAAPMTIMVLLAIVAAALIAFGFYVKNIDTIFPKVFANGINLSGMTYDEARQRLVSLGYENNAEGVMATIEFPDGSSFSVSGEEAGFALDAAGAARAAFEYGRNGSFFANGFAFIRSFLSGTELNDIALSNFNESKVREIASESTQVFNDSLLDDAYEINSDHIVIVKGRSFSPAVESDVYALTVDILNQAMAAKSHLSAQYTPDYIAPKEVDLQMLYNTVYVEPVSSEYEPETYTATASVTGVSFNLNEATAMMNRAAMGEHVIIPLIFTEPEVTAEYLDSLLFRDTLAETTTYVAGTSNRVNNVRLSSSSIDGTVLNPGDTFTFNGIVGERTAERGFKEAGAYVGNLMVQEIGGGICQTSSTIYYSVLKADLEVLERQPHNMTVGYLPLGGDATINWGTIDLRFKNNTDYPIRVEMELEGLNLTARLVGTKLDESYINITYTIISSTASEEIEREDESIPEGERKVYTEGSTGYVVDTYKHYYDGDDNLTDTVYVGRSTYYVQHRIILIPPEPEESEESEENDEIEDNEESEVDELLGDNEETSQPEDDANVIEVENPSEEEVEQTAQPSESEINETVEQVNGGSFNEPNEPTTEPSDSEDIHIEGPTDEFS